MRCETARFYELQGVPAESTDHPQIGNNGLGSEMNNPVGVQQACLACYYLRSYVVKEIQCETGRRSNEEVVARKFDEGGALFHADVIDALVLVLGSATPFSHFPSKSSMRLDCLAIDPPQYCQGNHLNSWRINLNKNKVKFAESCTVRAAAAD